jgi:hypothetical protein
VLLLHEHVTLVAIGGLARVLLGAGHSTARLEDEPGSS